MVRFEFQDRLPAVALWLMLDTYFLWFGLRGRSLFLWFGLRGRSLFLFNLCVFLLEIVRALLDFGSRLLIVSGSNLNKRKSVKKDTENLGKKEKLIRQIYRLLDWRHFILCQVYFYKMEGKIWILKVEKLVYCRLEAAEKSRCFTPWQMGCWADCCCVGMKDEVSTPYKQAPSNRLSMDSLPALGFQLEHWSKDWDAEM